MNAKMNWSAYSFLVLLMSISEFACVATTQPDEGADSADEASKKKQNHDAGIDSGGHAIPGNPGNPNDASNPGKPSSPIDLSVWQLQLPTGSQGKPDVVTNLNGFNNAYFYLDTDGALTFMDPRTGVTTSGSLHPRSELREVTAGWPATGTNTLTADVEVPLVPAKVTIGQIFQAPNAPSKPLLELEYQSTGDIKLLLERDINGSSGAGADLLDVGHVQAGARFTYQIALSNNAIQITIDGKPSPFVLPPTFHGENFYFKAGAYDQTATAGTPSLVAGTIVKFYSLAVVHVK